MLQLNPTVGVAPGTTTMTLGGLGDQSTDYSDCPQDEPWQYVNPPQIAEGPPPGVSSDATPPYPATSFWDPMTSAQGDMGLMGRWDPYTDWPSLKGPGLGQTIGDTRWSFVIVAGIAAFAVTFGLLYLRRKKAYRSHTTIGSHPLRSSEEDMLIAMLQDQLEEGKVFRDFFASRGKQRQRWLRALDTRSFGQLDELRRRAAAYGTAASKELISSVVEILAMRRSQGRK
jgi:hypothetical protein